MFTDSFRKLGSVVAGEKIRSGSGSERLHMINVMEDLGRFLNIKLSYSSNPDLNVSWYQEQFFRPQGIMWREIRLQKGWFNDAFGVMLGTFTDGRPVALLPGPLRGYFYKDPDSGKRIRITQKNAGQFREEATLYYRPLPLRRIDRRDILDFIKQSVTAREIILLIMATFIVVLLGMVTPAMTSLLLSQVTETKDYQLLTVIFTVLIVVTAATFLISSMKQLVLAKISTKVAVPLQAAFMMRVLSAPAGDLKYFSAGDLGSKIGSMYNNLKILQNMFLSMILTLVCSFICFVQMFRYAPGAAGIAVLITAGMIALYIRVILLQADVSADRMEFQAEESGLTYSLIAGMQKISLSGAEKRAFSIWAQVYHKAIRTLYDPPLLLKIFGMLTPVIMLSGTIIMYLSAAHAKLQPSDFAAFLSSYGLLTGALTLVSTNASNFANALPIIRVLKPVMEFEPEIGKEKEVVQKLKGNISMQNITFRYDAHMPPVLENLNLEIKSGDYVAIVGPTGCGKTTIMRLLLGFETAGNGEIFYDGRNLKTLDLTSLRRRIGTVLQSGDIFQGTIFSNITISGGNLSEDDAWEAAEIAGIADDIRRLPLKMNTPLPDGGRGVSGGQKQRLLIARAIATRPSIIFFDEATSALDNVTQKAVSDAIGEMSCTRIVIAHRLSTIRDCDRIYCLDKGRFVEEGSYEELMEKDGFFAGLVRRQQI